MSVSRQTVLTKALEDIQAGSGSIIAIGVLMLYKCDSMEALLEFWNSPAYQEAMKLRAGIVESNFTVAIEATDQVK
jgi:uncharacterized protein (DUF1330 family)